MAYFVPRLIPFSLSALQYEGLVQSEYPNTYQQILTLYPPQANIDNRLTYALLLTHQLWSCPSAQIILSVNKYNDPENGGYLYYLDHVGSFGSLLGPFCGEAVCHGEDIIYVWDTLSFISQGLYNLTPDEQVLSNTIQRYWGYFSATGKPKGPGQIEWPRFVRESNISMVFDTPTNYHKAGQLQQYCNFWDSQNASTL